VFIYLLQDTDVRTGALKDVFDVRSVPIMGILRFELASFQKKGVVA
jgi:hypothetical protein